jgi:undecaprenyl diphosphate synthase
MSAAETPPPPRHIAIIMDGNGRWAQAHGEPRVVGHREGALSVRAITREARRLGVEAITLYSFSTENWGRPDDEVMALMGLLLEYLLSERGELLDNDIRLTHAGQVERLPSNVQDALYELEEASAHCESMVLNLALSYGSRQEIVRAVKQIVDDVAAGTLDPDSIDEDTVSSRLYTAGLPDPDLLIRTSGELRLSNFLLWQVAYAELYVTELAWPEFREEALNEAIAAYHLRRRRFGLTGAQVTKEDAQ